MRGILRSDKYSGACPELIDATIAQPDRFATRPKVEVNAVGVEALAGLARVLA